MMTNSKEKNNVVFDYNYNYNNYNNFNNYSYPNNYSELKNYSLDNDFRNYYDVNYNVPLIDINIIQKYDVDLNYDSKYNLKYNSNFNQRYRRLYDNNFTHHLSNKLVTDVINYAYDGRNKPVFNDKYMYHFVKDYISSKIKASGWKGVLKYGAKRLGKSTITGIKLGLNYSSCVMDETRYLENNNMLNHINHSIALGKCSINTGYNEFSSELNFIDGLIGNAVQTRANIAIDNMYIRDLEMTDRVKMNDFIYFNKYNEFMGPLIVIGDLLSKPINNSVDFVVDKTENLIIKSYDYLEEKFTNKNDVLPELTYNYQNFEDPRTNFSIQDKHKLSNNEILLYNDGKNQIDNEIDDIFNEIKKSKTEFEKNNNINDFPDTSNLLIEDIENIHDIDNLILDAEVHNYVDFIDKEISKIGFDTQKIMNFMSNASTFVGLCNLLRNFKDMEPGMRLLEIECFIVSLKTSDSFVNGMFSFVKDIATQGKIKLKNFVDLGVCFAEKMLNLPLKNACTFITKLFKGERVNDYFKPLLMDIVTIFIPSLNILKMAKGIIHGIESLFSRQHIKKVNGIDCVYTDHLKIGFFKIRHKISYDNDFFGIHIKVTSRHASTAKKIAEKQFKKELDKKVYEVIGIPVEFINGTIKTPNNRYESYAQRFYLKKLEEKWLEVNNDYLNENQKKLIQSMYFESQEDKNYRYDLSKNGEAPSWYWNHKKDNIFDFSKELYKQINNYYRKNPIHSIGDFNKFISLVCKALFNNKKIKKNNDLGKTESESQNKIFEKARDKRSKLKNNTLDKFRNNERNTYNSKSGQYSRDAVISTACLELLEYQQTVQYIVESGYSSWTGYLGSYLAYIDYEIQLMKNNIYKYPFLKILDYVTNFVQGYITRVLCDQTTLWVSLLEYTQDFTDDFLRDYINPFISTTIGLGIGIVRFIVNPSYDKITKVIINGGISAINASFGIIYNYLKKDILKSVLDTTLFNDITTLITKGINAMFNLGFTVDFVSIVSMSLAFNLGIRAFGIIYNLLTNKEIPNILAFEKEESINDLEINPIVKDLELEKSKNDLEINEVITEIKKTNDLENNPNISDLEKTNIYNIQKVSIMSNNITSKINKYNNIKQYKYYQYIPSTHKVKCYY